MKYRKSHYHHHHHHHFDAGAAPFVRKPDGFIKGTIRKLAERFGVSFKLIVAGFVLLFLFTGFFALVAFLVAAHWVRHPDKYEDFFDTAFEKSRRGFNTMTGNRSYWDSSMAGGPGAGASAAGHADDDFDFADLNRKFDDLKRRASSMEEHVSSEDYKLNKQFDDLK